MCKVFIRSRDKCYAQYLKSLVQQITVDHELSVQHVCGPESISYDKEASVLLVVYQNSALEDIGLIQKFKSLDQIIWIRYRSEKTFFHDSSPNTIHFSRPLDCFSFIQCVYQWYKKHSRNRRSLKPPPMEPFLVGNNPAIQKLRKDVARISEYDLAVLVCGATGTGKGVVAQTLHNNSPRAGHKFLTINCANLQNNLMESELFGYKRGAFTGALSDKPGRFELAQEGTIFLDEISDMSTYMQAKLLQVLQEKEFSPLGGVNRVQIQARIVAATNTDLKNAISQGAFREDLYYRLAVLCLEVPELKDRKEDIPVLVNHYLDKFSLVYKKSEVPNLSNRFWEFLMAYDWPGNVRELESSMKTVVALENEEPVREEMSRRLGKQPAKGYSEETSVIRKPDPTQDLNKESSLHDLSLPEIVNHTVSRIEAMLIRKALEQTGAKNKAAQALGISYKSLLNKIKRYGL